MLKNERSLLIGVTFNTGRVGAYGKPRLLKFKAAVRIVTITALHLPLEHFVMEGPAELRFGLAVTANAELGLTLPQHVGGQQIDVSPICF